MSKKPEAWTKNRQRQLYRELRAENIPAASAWYMARIFTAWEKLKEEGKVRLRCEPDQLLYDDSYIETWGLSAKQVEREKARLWKRLERVGVWVYIAEVWDGSEWQVADAIGGVDGELAVDYKSDLCAEAIMQVLGRESLRVSGF